MRSTATAQDILCFHCGQSCEADTCWHGEKPFCCNGCKTVFEILNENNLCEYYSLEKNPGIPINKKAEQDFAYLNELPIRKKILSFDSIEYAKISFSIPTIHCISCIWLLENLRRLDAGVLRSEVNFRRKTVTIDFHPEKIMLSRLAALLTSIGYEPTISWDEKSSGEKLTDKSLVYKLAVAGFCFGNVMLFSFPDYLGIDESDSTLMYIFSRLNLVLALPVFFYSGFGYLHSAFLSFKQKQINIDVPIAVGLIALFLRSSFDILSSTGPGYLDSFTGLVFFLLIGRWFQSKTYESLSFERDFKSYFPLAINKFQNDDWKPVVIYELQKGDTIQVRNMEIVPADSLMKTPEALIDYGFVTGEARPVKVYAGDLVYAGGRLIGEPIRLNVVERTSQSHLTSLWNNEVFRKRAVSRYQKIIDRAARKFTWVVMGIALLTGIFWYWKSPSEMWLVLTSVLMVACPCALALAAPFTYGNMLRVFGGHKFYLKNADVIERMAAIDAVVFDKTGTVTYNQQPNVKFVGRLSNDEMLLVKRLTASSAHPLSKIIADWITRQYTLNVVDTFRGAADQTTLNVLKGPDKLMQFKEWPGKGIEGLVDGHLVRVGSAAFTGATPTSTVGTSQVFVSIDGELFGYFTIAQTIRENLKPMLSTLAGKYVALLSGDSDTDRKKMESLFGRNTPMLFNQSPHDKLAFIRNLQQQGKKVMMIGDGLNDAGAFKQADVGIAVTDDTGLFTPASDGILRGEKLQSLDKFLSLAKSSSTILKLAFVISFLYNAVALSFAVTGHLTPLVAAVLMPISSISVVVFSTLAVRWVSSRKLFQP
jgi:P-type Cu+ transporter